MNNYISQLIQDIHKASWNVTPPHELWLDTQADPDNEVELDDMVFAEKYLYGKEIPVEEITGILREQLPAPDLLNEEQRTLLATELEKLLDIFHFVLDFPDSFPMHLRYSFIRDFWAESHVPLSFGDNHIEFCEMDEEDCPFPGYCDTCKLVEEQMKADEALGAITDDYDFDIQDLLPSDEELKRVALENRALRGEDDNFDKNQEVGDDLQEELPFVGGFFDDEGKRINEESIPVPGLCILCRSYLQEDWEENFLCQMTRYDQRNSTHFECDAFKKDN